MATKNIVQIATDGGDGARPPTTGDVFLGENPLGNVPFYATTLEVAQLANSQITIDVKAFGATGDGVTDDSASIQAAVDSMSTVVGGQVMFPPGTYRLTAAGIVIPKSTTGVFSLIGYGAKLITSTAIKMISRERPIDNNDAINSTASFVHIEGLELEGSTITTTGIEMSALYGLAIQNIQVEGCITAYDLIFCLNSMVLNCYSVNAETDGFVARTGVGEWPGAASANSQSNHTKFIGCRSFAKSTQDAQFKILGCSGIDMQSCITEGANPVYGVFFDDEAATVVRSIKITNHHSENSPTGSVFRIIMGSGMAIIEQPYHQIAGQLMLDAADCGASARISLDKWSYVPGNSTFKTESTGIPVWYIYQVGNIEIDFLDPARWEGGIVAKFMQVSTGPSNRIGIFSSTQIDLQGFRVLLDASDNKFFIFSNIYSDKTTLATTPGSVIRRLPLYDADTDSFIGYIPVYDDIT